MAEREGYVIYAYFNGNKKGEKFYAPANTRLEEKEPDLMRYVDGVPLEIAQKICNNGKQSLEAELLLISTLMALGVED